MGSESSGRRSESPAELLDFSLPLSGDEVRELDEIRFAHPMPFETYLEVVSQWSDWWISTHGQRGPDEGFTEPFSL